MKISTLEMTGYKKYASKQEIEFGDITIITGENGTGKSTIADAIAFLLYGVDSFGSKDLPANLFDPMDTVVRAEFTVDEGTQVALERHILNGKTKLFISEVPVKASEFKEVIENYFTKERFLTLFNPVFFATQHWTAQREQFMANVETPLNATVLDACGDVAKEVLESELKKLDIDKLEAKQRNVKKTTDSDLIKLRERLDTYKKMTSTGKVDTAGIEKELQEIEELQNAWKIYGLAVDEFKALQKELADLNEQLVRQAEVVNTKKTSEPLDTCTACGQNLPEENILVVQKRMDKELEEAKEVGKKLLEKRKVLKEQVAQHTSPARPSNMSLEGLLDRKLELTRKMDAAASKDYSKEIEETQKELQKVSKENGKSAELLDFIKLFRSMRTDIMVKSIDELFDRLSLKLFNELANGSIESTFEIEFDGKPYRTLSTAERILAGLELRNAFLQLNDRQESAPVFIDCAESVSTDVSELTDGQVIVAEVKREEFAIEKKERVTA